MGRIQERVFKQNNGTTQQAKQQYQHFKEKAGIEPSDENYDSPVD